MAQSADQSTGKTLKPQANPLKGEAAIKLGGEWYIGRLSIDNILRLESATGGGIIDLAVKFARAEATTHDVINVLSAALVDRGDKPFDQLELFAIMQREGVASTYGKVSTFLNEALNPDDGSKKGKQKAAGSA